MSWNGVGWGWGGGGGGGGGEEGKVSQYMEKKKGYIFTFTSFCNLYIFNLD